MSRSSSTKTWRLRGMRSYRMIHNSRKRRLFLLCVFSLSIASFFGFKLIRWYFGPEPLHGTFMAAEIDNKRLGNAMFIYAALVGISTRLELSYAVDRDLTLLDVFNLTAVTAQDFTSQLPGYIVYEEYGRRASAFDFASEKLKPQNTILKGYFQSWRYFRLANEKVRKEFTFLPKISVVARQFLNNNKPKHVDKLTRIGVHVRRGDLLEEQYKKYGYTVADEAYFQHAMDHFKQNYSQIQFVVCSDDIQWAKEHVKAQEVIYSEGHTDSEDLAILSQCDHSIISVGSFGWWCAWLANGKTIYYADWPREYSQLEYHINKKTYFPDSWIPLR